MLWSKTITSTIEHNSIWISMRVDHSITYSHSSFMKDSQRKQECKSNPKPANSSNYPHQIPNHPESQKPFLLESRAGCTTCAAGHWPQIAPLNPSSSLLGRWYRKVSSLLTLLVRRTFGKGRTSQKIKIWPNPTLFYLKITIWDGTATSIWETAIISGYLLPRWKRVQYLLI